MYRKLEARLHDLFWEAGEDGQRELGLIKGLLDETGGNALELGCGSGRLLVPLLRRGFDIEGLENSPDMIELCHDHLEREELHTKVHEADMSAFDLGSKRYRNIIIPAFSLQLLANASAVDTCLRAVFKHLEPGGSLYFSCFIPWAELLGELPEGEWYDDDQIALQGGGEARLRSSFQLHVMEQRLLREHLYEVLDKEGQVTDSQHSAMTMRFFYLNELRLLLKQHHFRLLHVFPDFTPRRIKDGEMPACLSLVARKRRSLAQRKSGEKALDSSELES